LFLFLKILEVIEGRADCYLYPRDGTKRWDTCAPEAILLSLNGKLTNVFGDEYNYEIHDINSGLVNNSTGIIATINNDSLHQIIINSITDEVKEDIIKKPLSE
jgi:3'(2'), 5'-bisphosphate nucleotidase